MKKKSVIYNALGFPIIIVNPSYIEFEGEKVLDVSPKKIQDHIFGLLINKPSRLTGAEVRFMRHYMELTQEALAEKLLLTNTSTVSKWESTNQAFTGMDRQTELVLRMRCKLHLNGRDRIAASFIDNISSALSTTEVGQLLQFAI